MLKTTFQSKPKFSPQTA